jgi:hypothetical protein
LLVSLQPVFDRGLIAVCRADAEGREIIEEEVVDMVIRDDDDRIWLRRGDAPPHVLERSKMASRSSPGMASGKFSMTGVWLAA